MALTCLNVDLVEADALLADDAELGCRDEVLLGDVVVFDKDCRRVRAPVYGFWVGVKYAVEEGLGVFDSSGVKLAQDVEFASLFRHRGLSRG